MYRRLSGNIEPWPKLSDAVSFWLASQHSVAIRKE